jgi:hypothetical protein
VSDLIKSQPTARCLSSGRVGLYVSGNAALEYYNLHVNPDGSTTNDIALIVDPVAFPLP